MLGYCMNALSAGLFPARPNLFKTRSGRVGRQLRSLDPGERVDDRHYIPILNRGLVRHTHLVGLLLQDGLRQSKLVHDNAGRVTGQAVVVNCDCLGSTGKGAGAGLEIDADRVQGNSVGSDCGGRFCSS